MQEFRGNLAKQLCQAVRHYILHSKNTLYTYFNLRGLDSGVKMSRLLRGVIEEMTYCLRKRNTEADPSTLREVHQMRHYVYELLYRLLPYQELDADAIRLYFRLYISVEAATEDITRKYHRLSWSQFQSVLTDAIRSSLRMEPGTYSIKDKGTDLLVNT